jgi:tRNA (cytidine32/uridine32-2'-O)-methyltransferase
VEEAATLVLADPDRTGLLFGRESSGLTNEELDWATHALVLPSAPDYPELNLAQSVLLVAAEIHRERIRRGASAAPTAPPEAAAASYEEIERLARRASVWFREIGFSQDLESDDGRRFRGAGWRPARGLLRMLLRARPRKHEIALLLGVLRQARIAARQKET